MNITIAEKNVDRIEPLIAECAENNNQRYKSCLDVGSGKRHMNRWFQKFTFSAEPKRFAAVEIDPEIIGWLEENNIEVKMPDDLNSREFDLTLAKEVLEHLSPEDTIPFLNVCESATNKVFALTTPNFEYWSNRKPIEKWKELKFIPQHLIYYKPNSSNPHDHRQEMSVPILTDYFERSNFKHEWNIDIFRAWPMEITDKVRGDIFRIYYKIMAICRRVVN